MGTDILITGAGGFIGLNAASFFGRNGRNVIALDNLSRLKHLKASSPDRPFRANWDRLRDHPNVERIEGDVLNADLLAEIAKDVDAILHTAGQTAVTASLEDPRNDFETNTAGTVNVLEAARQSETSPAVLFCSTNKVYGHRMNQFDFTEDDSRYRYRDPDRRDGVTEEFGVDHAEHTPYGCSKLAADLYVQEYGRSFGLRTGVFRLSCVYGPHQLGLEDQGWLAWFTLATLLETPITLYGNGKQVRDVLYVDDLVELFEAFLEGSESGVWNVGGGPGNTVSLLEVLDLLEEITGLRSELQFDDWRPADQTIYVSSLKKVQRDLGWTPSTNVREGMNRLVAWMSDHRDTLAGFV